MFSTKKYIIIMKFQSFLSILTLHFLKLPDYEKNWYVAVWIIKTNWRGIIGTKRTKPIKDRWKWLKTSTKERKKGAGRQKYIVSIKTRPVSRPKQVADGWAGAGICAFTLLHGQAKLEFGIQRVKIQNLGLVTWNTA